MGKTEEEIALVPILQPEQHRHLRASRLVQQLFRNQDRHVQLLAAESIGLLAHDLGDLLVDAPAQRQIGVDSRRQVADEAAAQQQLMAGQLRIFGNLTLCRKKQLGRSHRTSLLAHPFSSLKCVRFAPWEENGLERYSPLWRALCFSTGF